MFHQEPHCDLSATVSMNHLGALLIRGISDLDSSRIAARKDLSQPNGSHLSSRIEKLHYWLELEFQ